MGRLKYREYGIYENQLLILQILYKFRFGTNNLIAEYRNKSRSTINESALTLLKDGYIERRYGKAHKAVREPAVYCLATKGVNYLKSRFTLTDKIANTMFKNRHVSDEFIKKCLTTFQAYLMLRRQYGDQYNLFTKSELAKFDQYPEQLPDLFLGAKQGSQDYMLDMFLSEPFFVIKKRVKLYIEHRNEDWHDETKYPNILLVCPDPRTEDKVIKYCESQLEDFDFFVTTVKAFLSGDKAIWTNPVEPERLIEL